MTLLLSQLLQFFPHVRILKLRVVVAAHVRRGGVSRGGRVGVAVHRRGLPARRIGALLAFAPTGAPQKRHRPLHEVASTVLGRGVSRGRRLGRGKDDAAVLVRRVRVEVRGVVGVATGRGVHRLGPGDVPRGDIGAGRRGGPIEVRRGGVAVTTLWFGRSVAIGCSCPRGLSRGRAVLVFPARALGLAV